MSYFVYSFCGCCSAEISADTLARRKESRGTHSMHSSKVQGRENWPLELRESHWRGALGVYWRVTSPPTHIGPAMEEAFRWFNWIDWTEYDAKDPDGKKEYYAGHIAPLVGALERLHLLAVKADKGQKRWRGKSPPDNRLFLAAREVAKLAKERLETLQILDGGPHTPRSCPALQSSDRLAGSPPREGSSGHKSQNRPMPHFRVVMPKYAECTKWPDALSKNYVKQSCFLLEGTEDWKIAQSRNQMHDAFRQINWYIYGGLIYAKDLNGLKQYYNESVSPLYNLLVRFVIVLSARPNGDGWAEKSIIPFLQRMEDAAKKMRDLYYSMPGSTYTSKWLADLHALS